MARQLDDVSEPLQSNGDRRRDHAGCIGPCLPTKTDKLPSGIEWLHEIKHDGFINDIL
jgi:ATP-dependent DNA ligase